MAPAQKTLPKLPKFRPRDGDPEKWFNSLDVNFNAFGIQDDAQRFAYAHNEIVRQTEMTLSDLTMDAPEEGKYEWLRSEVSRRLGITPESRMIQLLKGEERGDRRPSDFVRFLKEKAPQSTLRDTQIKLALIRSMPQDCQRFLQPFIENTEKDALDQMVRNADIFHDNPVSVSTIQQPAPIAFASASAPAPSASACPSTSAPEVTFGYQDKNDLMAEIQAMIANALGPNNDSNGRPRRFTRQNSRPSSNARYANKSGNRGGQKRGADTADDTLTHNAKGICLYHIKFGESARKCLEPCNFEPKN